MTGRNRKGRKVLKMASSQQRGKSKTGMKKKKKKKKNKKKVEGRGGFREGKIKRKGEKTRAAALGKGKENTEPSRPQETAKESEGDRHTLPRRFKKEGKLAQKKPDGPMQTNFDKVYLLDRQEEEKRKTVVAGESAESQRGENERYCDRHRAVKVLSPSQTRGEETPSHGGSRERGKRGKGGNEALARILSARDQTPWDAWPRGRTKGGGRGKCCGQGGGELREGQQRGRQG